MARYSYTRSRGLGVSVDDHDKRLNSFTLHKYRVRDNDTKAAVDISVHGAQEVPTIQYGSPDEYAYNELKRHYQYNEDGKPLGYAVTTLEPLEQGRMFRHVPAKFDHFNADPSMKIPAMTLAMRAVMDHPGIEPSGNLSSHSAKLVRKAVDLGVVNAPPSNRRIMAYNGIEFGPNKNNFDLNIEIPDQDVQRARHQVRSLIRPPKDNNHMSVQFHQLQLPLQGI